MNRSNLSSSLNTILPDNTAGLITPAVLRGSLVDIINSTVFPEDTGSVEIITGSFATTGSNTFIGNQTITGSVNITGSLTVNTVNVGQNTINFIDNNGIIINSLSISSGSTNITISTGSIQTSGSAYFSGSFTGSLLGTASYALFAANGGGGGNIDTGSFSTTGSNTFRGSQTIDGNLFMSGAFRLVYNNDPANNMLFGQFDGSNIHGPYYQLFGNQYPNTSQRGGAEFVYDTRNGGDANFHVSSFNGAAWTQKFRVDDNGVQITGSLGFGDKGLIQSISSSSGDGLNASTLVLKPDTSLGSDQYIVLDPTAPGHIHIRAGGTIDESSAYLYLGGENNHIKVDDYGALEISSTNTVTTKTGSIETGLYLDLANGNFGLINSINTQEGLYINQINDYNNRNISLGFYDSGKSFFRIAVDNIITAYNYNDVGLKLDFANNEYSLGDSGSVGNGNSLIIDNVGGTVTLSGNNNDQGLQVSHALSGRVTTIGDYSNVNNSTKITIDDTNQTVTVSGSVDIDGGFGASYRYVDLTSTGNYVITDNLPFVYVYRFSNTNLAADYSVELPPAITYPNRICFITRPNETGANITVECSSNIEDKFGAFSTNFILNSNAKYQWISDGTSWLNISNNE